MLKPILIAVLLGLTTADNIDRDAEIRSFRNDVADAEGNFAYSFDSSNGIDVQESGNVASVSGQAKWVSPEGIPIELTYTADENGYHPSGDHLPTPPPIPEAILRALEYIRTHPPKGVEIQPDVPIVPYNSRSQPQKVRPTPHQQRVTASVTKASHRG